MSSLIASLPSAVSGPIRSRAPHYRRWLGFVLKAAIAAALVYWLLATNQLDAGALASIAAAPHAAGLILLAVASVLAGQVCLALRLVILFRSSCFHVSFLRSLLLTCIGSLAGVATPGLVGGDALKAFYLCGDAVGRRSHAVATVVVDRIIGLYALFLLACGSLAAAWLTGSLPPLGRLLWVMPLLTAAATLGLALAAWSGDGRAGLLGAALQRLPPSLQNLAAALHDRMRQPKALVAAVALSLLNHALVVVTFVIAGALISEPLPLTAHFLMSPVAMAVNMVPLTPGGVGLTEGAFAFLYQAVPLTHGATIGLVGRILQYLAFVLGGGPAMLLARMPDLLPRQRLSEF